jgi:adenylylsulfate kinase-like enzyme
MSTFKNHNRGLVIWITGLSGAGKSTLASETAALLRAAGNSVVILDGDELREVFGAVTENQQNYSHQGRLALAMQYAHLCRIFAAQGLIVVVATISLFREVHTWNRINLQNYFEVYLKMPPEELRRRDPKGIYRRFDAGELKNIAGLDLPIDEPSSADWVVEFVREQTATVLAEELVIKLNGKYE